MLHNSFEGLHLQQASQTTTAAVLHKGITNVMNNICSVSDTDDNKSSDVQEE